MTLFFFWAIIPCGINRADKINRARYFFIVLKN
jgi:hypothetical protein